MFSRNVNQIFPNLILRHANCGKTLISFQIHITKKLLFIFHIYCLPKRTIGFINMLNLPPHDSYFSHSLTNFVMQRPSKSKLTSA